MTSSRPTIVIIGPVYPYRGGIAYCTTALATELSLGADVRVESFHRQYPKHFYPGKDDRDPSLAEATPANASFRLDILNPFTWLAAAIRIRQLAPDAVVFVWWIWVWALPYFLISLLAHGRTTLVAQCHNIADKEPSPWKSWLTNTFLRSVDRFVVHSKSLRNELLARFGEARAADVATLFLPAHAIGGEVPSREESRRTLEITAERVALFFGHVRPYKGLDVALRAWALLKSDVLLVVAGEVWWNDEAAYLALAASLGLRVQRGRLESGGPAVDGDPPQVHFDFRFVPDDQAAAYFAAADVVVAPYRTEAQSGVVMTSLHFGRPVIATGAGGIPEVIGDGREGILIPIDDPDALADAVDRFFTTCDRSAMEGSAKDAARKYSWSEYGSRVRNVMSVSRAEMD